jgi:hypothetical protein
VTPDGQKTLAAGPIAILENIDGRMALASDAEAFGVRIPDCLARCQLGDRFDGNPADCQLATNCLKLRQVCCFNIKHYYYANYDEYLSE